MTAASIILGAIGTGISFYGQQQAAKTEANYALLNAQAGQAQAQMQSRLALAQAALQTTQARNQQQEGIVNAAALRGEAEQKSAANRINIERNMQDQARFNSMLIARGGKSGTVNDTGSPLDILAYSAELENSQNAEMLYQNELERRSLYRQAQAAELGADRSYIQGEIYGIEGAGRASAFKAQGVQAQLKGIAGVQAAQGASLGAWGGLASGVGGLINQRYQAFRFSET